MKKLTKKLLLAVLSTFMLFGLTMGIGCDCGDSGSQGGGVDFPSTPVVAEVSLSTTSVKMIVGDYFTVTAYTNKAPGLSVEFSSEDESIATIDKFGLIEAVNKGTTNIVAKYGDVTKKCAVTVDFDESVPEIIDLAAFNKEYVLYKGDSLTFQPAIKYRGRIYTDGQFNFVSTDDSIVAFDGYTLTAQDKVNVANCYIEGSWRGFDASNAQTLRKDFSVKVMTEAYISLQGTSEDFIELYTHASFDGVNYKNTNTFVPEFYAEGNKIENVEFNYELSDDSIIDFTGDSVSAKFYGEVEINVSCEYEGIEYVKTFSINVLRPVADYQAKLINFSTGLGTFKDAQDNYKEKTIANKIYGTDDVVIIEASQDGKPLIVQDNKVLGIKGLKDDALNTVVTIGTSTEIYNVELLVYGLYIKTAEDLAYFSLYPEYVDYYYLANDIDASNFSMPQYGTGPYGSERKNGLMGVFEGNGHVIKNFTANTRGIFGSLNGGTIQNVAFVNTKLSGYYPCLIAHWEEGTSTIKNMYVHFDDIPKKGGGLFQQKFSLNSVHENVVVEYAIAPEDVLNRVTTYNDNSANISTFAPQRAQTWSKNEMFKNCFSISYAPIGLSQPRSTDYSWASYIVAENQVVQTENAETGKIDLTFIDDFEKELAPHTGFSPIKKTQSQEDAIEVVKGIKAYHTIADMQADATNNAKILQTFDPTYWVVENGVPYWKGVYVSTFDVSVMNGENPVEGKIVLSNNTTELTISIVDGNGNPVETTITGVEGIVVNGNKVRLAEVPTSKGTYEIVASAIVKGVVIEKVITIGYSNEIEVGAKVLYSADDKSLDLVSLNKALAGVDFNEITFADIDTYKVNGEEVDVLDLEVIISNNSKVNQGRNRSVDVAQEVTLIIKGKTVILNNVLAYTKIIDEAEDLKYFTMKYQNVYNEVDGYFVLSKNIDASALELDEHQFESNKDGGKIVYPGNGVSVDVGFRGVLDGQGYTIDGLTVKSCGLFANMNAPVIKNIAFTNVNLGGYYSTLFAKNFNRGKSYANEFNGYEGMFQNVYISINSITYGADKNVGILTQGTLPGTVLIENVIIDYLNVSQEVQAQVEAGKNFYMFGSSGLTMSAVMRFRNCYSISSAPVLYRTTMPGFAENQVEFTLSGDGKKVASVGKVLDEQVNELLAIAGKTLTVDHVLVGVKAYDDYAAMKAANNDYTSFSADYWTIVDGVPTWKN